MYTSGDSPCMRERLRLCFSKYAIIRNANGTREPRLFCRRCRHVSRVIARRLREGACGGMEERPGWFMDVMADLCMTTLAFAQAHKGGGGGVGKDGAA